MILAQVLRITLPSITYYFAKYRVILFAPNLSRWQLMCYEMVGV